MIAFTVCFCAFSAGATVVQRASLRELSLASQIVVHAIVHSVDEAAGDNRFETAIDLEIVDVVKGLASDQRTFHFVLPGGRLGAQTMRVPGMPHFKAGDEVVLMLESTASGYALTGFSQGLFKVDRSTSVPKVRRVLGDLKLVGKPATRALAEAPEPRDLSSLLAQLKALARLERQ